MWMLDARSKCQRRPMTHRRCGTVALANVRVTLGSINVSLTVPVPPPIFLCGQPPTGLNFSDRPYLPLNNLYKHLIKMGGGNVSTCSMRPLWEATCYILDLVATTLVSLPRIPRSWR